MGTEGKRGSERRCESFDEIYARAAERRGGEAALEAALGRIPVKAARTNWRPSRDDRWLAEMTRGVFRAGFNWRVIDNKWPGFEAAFHAFDPPLNAAMSEEEFDAHLKDTRHRPQRPEDRLGARQRPVPGRPRRRARQRREVLRRLAGQRLRRPAGGDEEARRALPGETAMRFFRTMGKPSFMTTRDVGRRPDRGRRHRQAALRPQGLPGGAGRLQRLERRRPAATSPRSAGCWR